MARHYRTAKTACNLFSTRDREMARRLGDIGMELKMHRSCNGCVANADTSQHTHECPLDYSRKFTGNGVFAYYKPLEECPKPTTRKEYNRLMCERSKTEIA